jgi:hypothetical protein
MPFQVSVQIPEPMIQNLNGREANLERTPPEANKQQSDPSYPELLASKTAEIRTKISRPEQASPDYAGTIAKADEGESLIHGRNSSIPPTTLSLDFMLKHGPHRIQRKI